jgi:hypothetical protein
MAGLAPETRCSSPTGLAAWLQLPLNYWRRWFQPEAGPSCLTVAFDPGHGPACDPTIQRHHSIGCPPLVVRLGPCRSMLALGTIGAPAHRYVHKIYIPEPTDRYGAMLLRKQCHWQVKLAVLEGCGRTRLLSFSFGSGRFANSNFLN